MEHYNINYYLHNYVNNITIQDYMNVYITIIYIVSYYTNYTYNNSTTVMRAGLPCQDGSGPLAMDLTKVMFSLL